MKSRIPTVFFGLVIPLFLILGCFSFYNTIEPRIFGFPFIYAWIFSCFAMSSLCMYIAWKLDPLSAANQKKRAESGAKE